MAEQPRDPKRPPIPSAVQAKTDSKAAPSASAAKATKAAKPAPHLQSLGESTQEALPLVMVDFGTEALAAINNDQTLILSAKQEVTQPARPKTVAPTESTLIIARDDKKNTTPAPKSEPTLIKTAIKPALKPKPKPEPKPEPKPAHKSEPKPAHKSEPKPESKQETKPAHKPEPKSVPSAGRSTDAIKDSAAALVTRSTQPEAVTPKAVKGIASPPHSPSRKQLQKRIRELIHRFDVPALLDALHHIGYRDDQIDFMSNPTLSHQGALLQDIEFLESPERVLVLANLGLMSGQGPIPSYFYELLAEQRDSAMTEFLWFFDNALLQQRFAGQFPERDERVIPDWSEVKRLQLALLQLGSPMGMHWLFRQVYPELPISVRRSLQKRRVRTEGVHMGESQLGSGCAFGGFTQVPALGIDVRLLCEDGSTPNGKPWANEAEHRLQRQIIPALDHVDLFLTVTLVFLDRQSFAKLAAQHYLGYDPIAAPKAEEGPPPVQQVILFQDEVGHNPH